MCKDLKRISRVAPLLSVEWWEIHLFVSLFSFLPYVERERKWVQTFEREGPFCTSIPPSELPGDKEDLFSVVGANYWVNPPLPREWLWSWPWATTPKSIYLYQSTRDDGPVCNCLDQQLKRNSNHHQPSQLQPSWQRRLPSPGEKNRENTRRLWNFLVRKNIASKQHLFTYIQNISKYTVQILILESKGENENHWW